MKQVTIVIPNYNGIKYLEECLGAVYKQRCSFDYQVLVVDNGSKDGSLALLEEKFPNTKVIALPENTGFCHAVNVGIRESDTPYIILLNNDTKVDLDFAQELYQAISHKENAFSVSAKMLMWDNPSLLDGAGDRYCALGYAFARGKGKPQKDYDKAAEVFSACGGAAIYRKSVFDKIGFFDEQHFAYLEDLDIGYRARIYGYKNYYAPDARVIHYGSAASGSRYNVWKTRLAAGNNLYVQWKNMPLLQLVWNAPLLLPGYLVKWLFFCKKGMGREYIAGLRDGIAKCKTPQGKKAKVAFQIRNLPNYLSIQLQMYAGIFQIIMKS